jgi:hypothetical protein
LGVKADCLPGAERIAITSSVASSDEIDALGLDLMRRFL